jgi:NADH-quinone oxidoreductase subunit G
MPTLVINGKNIEVAAGASLIEAARLAGAEVPHFCYHPGLPVAGNCRMCLVELEGAPKLQIACNTPVAEGMKVHTDSEKVRKARAGVMEFLLLNHPIDCPVCDCAGECMLQDHYMEHGLKASRLEEPKNKKKKAVDIGTHVMLDTERCILCSRCVRFTDTVSASHELGIFGRGSGSEIGLVEGARLENPYSGNVVDLCPVGALTDKQFRFKSRPWYLESTDTICAGCSKGCSISLDINPNAFNKVGEGRAYRITPRFHPDVNGHWMCDEGRYAYPLLDQNRLETARVDGLKAEDSDALEKLAALIKARPKEKIAFLLSAHLTLEELAAWQWLAKGLGIEQVGFGEDLRVMGASDSILIQADKSPNAKGAQLLGLGVREGLRSGKEVLEAARQGGMDLLVIGQNDGDRPERWAGLHGRLLALACHHQHSALAEATVALPLAMWAEKDGTFVNHQGRAQRLRKAMAPLGRSRAAWSWAFDLGGLLGMPAPQMDNPEALLAWAVQGHTLLHSLSSGTGPQGLVIKA